MYKGIYIAASGAVLKQTQLEVITQNMANANTTGYKKDSISFTDYLFQAQAGAAPDGRTMSDYSALKTDFSNGTMVKTGNSLDIAVDGAGLIALEGGKYTRRGDLKKDSEGYLSTHDGVKVLGGGGPILLPADATEISIDLEGKISIMQPGSSIPSEVDTIRIVEFDPAAQKSRIGSGQFTVTGSEITSTSGVKQGFLETSNVEAVKEMVRMIESMREFESYQKIIQVFDETTAKVNNELGRL